MAQGSALVLHLQTSAHSPRRVGSSEVLRREDAYPRSHAALRAGIAFGGARRAADLIATRSVAAGLTEPRPGAFAWAGEAEAHAATGFALEWLGWEPVR